MKKVYMVTFVERYFTNAPTEIKIVACKSDLQSAVDVVNNFSFEKAFDERGIDEEQRKQEGFKVERETEGFARAYLEFGWTVMNLSVVPLDVDDEFNEPVILRM